MQYHLEIKKPTLLDISDMEKLVLPEVESGIILQRSENEIANAIRSYSVVLIEGKIVAFCALHIHTLTLAEVRSLVVSQNLRGYGVGTKLVKSVIEEAISLGVKEVLTLTYHKSFFENLGFVEIPKQSIPEQKIWADCIKCKHFLICNEVSLIKKLS